MGRSVLIVESDKEYLDILRMYVRDMGIFDHCYIAENGREAIELALEKRPDIVITALVLPGIDGIGVISELSGKLEHTSFVVSTALKSDFAIEMAVRKGAHLYFAKPTEYNTFRDRLMELMGQPELRETVIVKNENRNDMAIITREIQKIGISAGIKGFQYVRYAIYLLLEENADKRMMKHVYPTIAKKFNTTVACVERDIRHAIEGAWTHGSMSYIDEVFGFTVDADKGKPTNTAFIVTVAERIRLGL